VNGLRAVVVDALDSDNDNGPRAFSVDREARRQGRVDGYCRAALEAQTLGASRNKEMDRDAGIPNNVTQALDSIVAIPVGDQNRLVIQDSNKARSVSTGRTIDSIRPDGCECEVRSQFYKGPVRGDQRVGFFRNRNPGRSVVKRLPAQQRWSPDFLLATSFPLLGLNGKNHIFDSFECAIQALAPTSAHCGTHVVGHGVEKDDTIYCCAHCAKQEGVTQVRDRA
jgi:hypothetical protein